MILQRFCRGIWKVHNIISLSCFPEPNFLASGTGNFIKVRILIYLRFSEMSKNMENMISLSTKFPCGKSLAWIDWAYGQEIVSFHLFLNNSLQKLFYSFSKALTTAQLLDTFSNGRAPISLVTNRWFFIVSFFRSRLALWTTIQKTGMEIFHEELPFWLIEEGERCRLIYVENIHEGQILISK